jgi:hypothetical protein
VLLVRETIERDIVVIEDGMVTEYEDIVFGPTSELKILILL